MILSKDAKKIISESLFQERLRESLELTTQLLTQASISPTELQWTVLINHINEMIRRSEEDEVMMGIDIEMFSEISEEALSISQKLVEAIGNLPQAEKYVLSIHFETAKQN